MAIQNFSSAGSPHEEFTEWAKAQGILINGVAAVRFPGRGIGIAALRDIDVGEIVVSVPTSSLLTLDRIPSTFKDRFSADTPVQGIIAAYLACDDEAKSRYAPWQATWPTMQDFESSMPLLWPEYLIGTPHEKFEAREQSAAQEEKICSPLLPPSISGFWRSMTPNTYPEPTDYSPDQQRLLQGQRDRYEKALNCVKQVYPSIDQKIFTYYYLAAHTRCFFYVAKDAEAPEDRSDAMALCPFADYFNHSGVDAGCKAAFNDNGYTFETTKSYEKGEEILVCYGEHTSDVLLVDYGFVPDTNNSDAVFLDDFVLQDISPERRTYLKEDNYLGNYQVNGAGACFRSEVAASLTYLSPEDWTAYIAGDVPSTFDQDKTDAIVAGWIQKYQNEAIVAIGRVENMIAKEGAGDSRLGMLLLRWRQIADICQATLASLSSS